HAGERVDAVIQQAEDDGGESEAVLRLGVRNGLVVEFRSEVFGRHLRGVGAELVGINVEAVAIEYRYVELCLVDLHVHGFEVDDGNAPLVQAVDDRGEIERDRYQFAVVGIEAFVGGLPAVQQIVELEGAVEGDLLHGETDEARLAQDQRFGPGELHDVPIIGRN